MNDWANQQTWNGIAYAVVAIAGALTVGGLWLFVPALRRRWFALPRLRPGTWTGHEVFLAFCVFFGIQDFILFALLQMGFFDPLIGSPPDPKAPDPERFLFSLRCLSVGSPLILALILGILFPVIHARTGSRPPHYGLTWARWPANLALGIVAFVLARPIIIGLYALAVLVFPPRSDPYSAFTLVEYPGWEWAMLAFQTSVAAPLLEEILCRGILLGWLRASLHGHLTFLSMTLFMTLYLQSGRMVTFDEATETYTYDFGAVSFAVLAAAGYGYALFHLARRFALSETEIQQWQPLLNAPALDAALSEDEMMERKRQARERFEKRLQAWADANATLAIFGSALFFAMLHANWPAPLALFPMGLILGWLYRRTQSLVAPIAFHVLFNLATFIALYGTVWSAT